MVLVAPPSMSIRAPCRNLPLRTGDERYQIRNILGFANPRDFFIPHEVLLGVLPGDILLRDEGCQPRLEARCPDGPRADGIHLHVVAQAGFRNRFGKGKHSRVYRASYGEMRPGCPAADTGDIDHRTGVRL